MENKFRIFGNNEQLAELLAGDLISLFGSVLKKKDHVNIALSGGSTPKLLFKKLADTYSDFSGWDKIKFFWADERCVPVSDKDSNYGEVKKLMFDKLNTSADKTKIPEENIFRMKGENDPEAEAESYSEILLSNLPAENSFPLLDVILLGLGEDGHTASIFPGMTELIDTNKFCAAVKHPQSGQHRITLTAGVINNSKNIIFLVSGKNKSGVVSDILNEKGDFEKYPAYFIKPFDGMLTWYLDKGAAGEVSLI
ncbi:MAG: 6-phosphogluconolactonase [Bacteroidetes bacterium]|nr:6-phosphogluconolactonase [Bacteroidota bacterium]